jgi:hypothetical protein
MVVSEIAAGGIAWATSAGMAKLAETKAMID